jgi:hypothetical protein
MEKHQIQNKRKEIKNKKKLSYSFFLNSKKKK